MKDEEIFQEIIVNETDNGTIDKITSKINKQTQANEKLAQSANKVNISNQGSTKKKTNGISAIKGSDNYSPELAAMYDKWAEEDSKKTSKKSSGNKVKASLTTDQKVANVLKGTINATNKSIEKLKKSLNFTDLVVKITALSTAVKGVFSFAESGTKIVEENNLFYNQLTNVSKEYGDLEKSATRYYEKAIDYQNKLYEATHLNRVENMKSQGTFFQLFNAQNVGEDLSYRLSESLSNAAIDLSSLFNIDYDQMVEKLKSGIIGNSRPLRELGIDVTEGTMQGILDNLGIDATVDQLSFAEKEVLRYMTILDQVGYAQGDFANTFMQSANQIRVFQNELTTVGQMIGTIFNKLLGNVLYVARGIIMAVEEILTALGSLIGVDWSDTGSTRPLASLGEEVDDVSAGIGGATAKAKEFKKQLMSFDEIHNITPPDSSSGGGGGGVGGLSGLLNSELSDAIRDWTSNFEKIDDRAKDIKDNILKTLGFTKDINGNLKWSAANFWDNIGPWGRAIVRAIQGILAFKIASKALSLYGTIKKIASFFTDTPLKGSGLEVGLDSLQKKASGTAEKIKGIWKTMGDEDAAIGDRVASLEKIIGIAAGAMEVLNGISGAIKDIEDVVKGTVNAADMAPAIVLRIGEAIAGVVAIIAALSNTINPIVSVIAAVVGIVAAIGARIIENNAHAKAATDEWKQWKIDIEDIHKANEKVTEDMKTQGEESSKLAQQTKSELDYYQKLKGELDTIVDKNGKIKDGYQTRAQVIVNELNGALGTNLQIVNGEIKDYDKLGKKIDEIIKKKKDEIFLNAYADDYTKALKEQDEKYALLTNSVDKYNEALGKSDYKTGVSTYNDLKNKLKELGIEYDETGDKLRDWQGMQRELANQLTGTNSQFYVGADHVGAYRQKLQDLGYSEEEIQGKLKEFNQTLSNATNNYEGYKTALNNVKTAQEEVNTAQTNWQQNEEIMIAYRDLEAAVIEGNNAKITSSEIALQNAYNSTKGVAEETIDASMKKVQEQKDFYVKVKKEQGEDITKIDTNFYDSQIKDLAENLKLQTKNVKQLTPEQVEAWKTLAKNSKETYEEQVSQLDGETQTLLNTLTGNVTAEQPEYWTAWSEMATNSREKFKEKIKDLPKDEQTTLLAGISTVKGCEQATVEAYGQLSEEGKIAYLGKIKELPETQRNKILEMLGEFGKQEGTAGTAAKELAGTIQKAINGEEIQIGDKQVEVKGKAIDDKIKNAIGTVTVPIKGEYKPHWQRVKNPNTDEYEYKYFAKGGRPAKGQIFVAREAGAELVGNIGGSTGVMNNIQIITAVAKGVSNAVASVLRDGFTVSIPQDNTVSNVQEQLVNEMRISNEYASQEFKQARPSVSSKYGFTTSGVVGSGTQGLVQMLAQAVEYGMNNANVNVNIEATTDTGVVIKQVSEAMNDYVNQTGQLPFAIPM